MRRLTGCMSNPFKPLTLQDRGEKEGGWREGAGCAEREAEDMEECNMDSWSQNRENTVKSIKWYYWPLKLIGELALKGPWKARMHDAALAAHIKHCFPFMLHWTCSRRREVGEGDSDKGSFSSLMAPMTLMTAALISDLMTPPVLGGAKLKQ